MITQNFYISSGAKNAMYTLRYERHSVGKEMAYCVDNYVCNLSTDAEKAEQKAKEYFDRFYDRVGENEEFKLNYCGGADFQLFERRNKLSVRATEQLEELDQGIMPFGKNKGKVISELPMNTILWWADNIKEVSSAEDAVFQAVCAYCLGIALEKGYIAKREADVEERQRRDALSEYMGEVKDRLTLEGVIDAVIHLDPIQVAWNAWAERTMNKIVVGDNVVIYVGKQLGEKGETIKFKATVKSHAEYKGVKQTIVQRPSLM